MLSPRLGGVHAVRKALSSCAAGCLFVLVESWSCAAFALAGSHFQASPLSTVLHVPVLEIAHRMTIESISDGGRESGHFLRALTLSESLLSSLSVTPAARISIAFVLCCTADLRFLSQTVCTSFFLARRELTSAWTPRRTCRVVYVINMFKSCMDVRKAGEPASSCYTSPNSNHRTLHKSSQPLPLLHFQDAGSTAYLSVHRGSLFTPTYCHTATHMVFNTDPDICSRIQGFASTAAPTKTYAA